MLHCQVQMDEGGKIQIPEKIRRQVGLKANERFNIYIDIYHENSDLYEQLIKDLIHQGVIIEFQEC